MNNFHSNYKEDSNGSVGLSFIKVYNCWYKEIKNRLKKIGITHPQFVVLASLGYLSQYKEEINQVDVAKQSDMDVMTVSTVIKNLEKQTLLRREVSLSDTRAKVVKLTPKGWELLNQALPIVETIDKEFFGKLGSEEKELQRLLGLLVE
ncbi:MarR family winged helix-turn-helix transcriptional regulator [Enterococcus faecalis]|uniref:MarR family winged helix-turn-helix transcriptional regulator n=1 Tax=Enterococcus faecalis TaxID=1351 RepID=UPI001145072D|nr:MarR family transcriptional regulator [Enterococcus faecalis]EGO9400005.1 MarR family transcriptional regulator [Enterococcus faecalis]EGO9465874.1 MarR family transcriptional regulator [Enterococcus faecalis]EHZ5160214.1 MarR family transcriptional regulator [Enterococcus faecalis]EKZ0210778.1 MarR family transcriptional regulator [Enterococcus faecalis]ELS0455659.1 MarR family transcriptional regulator [Enterococcus faecalis]